MAQCESCKRRRAARLDYLCATCLDALRTRLAEALVEANNPAPAHDDWWWATILALRQVEAGGPEAA